MKLKFLILVFTSLLISCEENEIIVLESESGFPDVSKNLSICNSEFDDYNSAWPGGEPGVYDLVSFVFSSNRNSKGKNFDLVLLPLSLSYKFSKKTVRISLSSGHSNESYNIKDMLPIINTEMNEYAPYIFKTVLNVSDSQEEFLLFYTQESNNRYKLMYFQLLQDPDYFGVKTYYEGPFEVNILNSDKYNVGYISIQDDNIYYNCDIDGTYDLYQLKIDSTKKIVDFLSQNINQQHKAKKIISSLKEDKCPYVIDSIMVFTSNREGGLGGYDIWYSKFNGNSWNEPVNLGIEVNSISDEYRPILIKYDGIPNDLMIFSSNKIGGKGGYDLYYVGIEENKY
jgi:hypothetical protein